MKQINTFLLLFFILLSISTSLLAQQTVRGKVWDMQSRTPLPGVNVTALPSQKGTVTDNNGDFSLEWDTTSARLNFSFVGYKTYSLVPNASQLINVYLEPSSQELNEVVVVGYENNRKLLETAGSIALLTPAALNRFSNTSLVPALSVIPGVRMEERSPGSYRLAIRGSSLRSPFGVRNVKIYWNEIPFTDPSGNTPLNLIDFSTVGRVEVIKGPAGSIYGAGTGGVVLLQNPFVSSKEQSVQVTGLAGSYGLSGTNITLRSGGAQVNTALTYAHQEAQGYRQQTAMRRDVVNFRTQYQVNEKRNISVSGLFSDLYYQTPGGVNAAQFAREPTLARQPVITQRGDTTVRGSREQKAAIYSQALYLGVSQHYQFSKNASNTTSLYGTFNTLRNPFISNYERKAEQGFGGRTKNTYAFNMGSVKTNLTFGGEFQQLFTVDKVYGNRFGNPDTLQLDAEIGTRQYIIFSQLEMELPASFLLTLGASLNRLKYRYQQFNNVTTNALQNREFKPVLSPRIALLRKLTQSVSAHGSISFGFSPPTLTEVLPSQGIFNRDLNAEQGINYELGLRGNWKKLSLDITAYSLQLRQTIVRRTAENGAEYFVNSGNTSQKGLETSLTYQLIEQPENIVSGLKLWTNYTYNHYRFKNYIQNETNYSNNKLTGVAPNVVAAGIDAESKTGLYTNITSLFTDFTPLDDANTVYANDYALLGGRIGFRRNFGNLMLELFGGVDNALNERYSLGNDLNAFGGRYFNPAAPRNYYTGLTLKYDFAK